ncbi:MAG: isoprenyl transferase [Actinomycetaceae bacterium]|nr:isoprenyl transferase [Actinomycetaceae bacterium]MDY6083561.1 isoprenyl transferase [Actinomycetaceae bacterium]
MKPPAWIYRLYEHHVLRQLRGAKLPEHIGVMLDGNRRWAREFGHSVRYGHKRGADKIDEFLGWCDQVHIPLVTLWLLSTDNLGRDEEEVADLLHIISTAVTHLASLHQWRIRIVGSMDLLPSEFVAQLTDAATRTADVDGLTVNIAVGYGGREEITDAVRSLLREEAAAGKTLEDVATSISVEDIAAHLYTSGQPDPDLVIRTSGEQRMSGFMLWQSVHTELYFCEAYWPDFRRTDFLRALRDYTQRERRKGK